MCRRARRRVPLIRQLDACASVCVPVVPAVPVPRRARSLPGGGGVRLSECHFELQRWPSWQRAAAWGVSAAQVRGTGRCADGAGPRLISEAPKLSTGRLRGRARAPHAHSRRVEPVPDTTEHFQQKSQFFLMRVFTSSANTPG